MDSEQNKSTDTAAKTNAQNKARNTPLIVGIGASAGGLEALQAMIGRLPVVDEVTYVIAQHMDPKHSSLLSTILARDTQMPVAEVQHAQQLESQTLYIIPPGMDAYYERKNDIRAHLPSFAIMGGTQREQRNGSSHNRRQSGKANSAHMLDHLLAEIYNPHCMILDEQLEITYIYGEVSDFLEFQAGRARLNILDLIRNDLRHDLRGLLYKAKRERKVTRSRRFTLSIKDELTYLTLVTKYFHDTEHGDEKYLLIFERDAVDDDKETTHNLNPSKINEDHIRKLEEELRDTRESLQTTIEELETANEELQSTYEEAQSTNEELFTSTEELQTANEELQSTNEELRTVNQELKVKSTEVESANSQLLQMNETLNKEITERRQAQQALATEQKKLRIIINSEPAWINIATAEGTIIEVNPAALSIMQADSDQNLLGKRIEDFALPRYRDTIIKCRKTVKEKKPMHLEVEIMTLKNERRWIDISSVLLPQGVAENAHLLSIISDQTERKQAQQELLHQQMAKARYEQHKTLGEVAASLAHELNQPLAAISNYLNGCERFLSNENFDPQKLLPIIKRSNQQTQRASDILAQIRNFVSQGEIKHEAIDINQEIRNAIETLQMTFVDKDVHFELDLAPLKKVSANRTQLSQVLNNLLCNAIESMQEKYGEDMDSGRIYIKTETLEQYAVSVSIADEGLGLPDDPKEVEQLFRMFYSTKTNGMGMGLAISRSVIEAHGGHLMAKNHPEGGTIMRFSLPLLTD